MTEGEIRLWQLLGLIGALAFVLEGIFLPVSLAAHIILFFVFRKLAGGKTPLLWLALSAIASISTAFYLGVTPVRMMLAPYPAENAYAVGILWLISAWFYWDIATRFGRLGFASSLLYALGAGLFAMRIGWLIMAAGVLTLALHFARTALREVVN